MAVHWVVLDLPPEAIRQRIREREKMGIYESKKCLEYFSQVYLELAAYYGFTVVNAKSEPACIAEQIVKLVESGACQEIQVLNTKTMTL